MPNKFTEPTTYPHKCQTKEGLDVVLYECVDGVYYGRYLEDGDWFGSGFAAKHLRDIRPKRVVKWVNAYMNGLGAPNPTRAEADEWASANRIAIYRIEYDAETGDNYLMTREDV